MELVEAYEQDTRPLAEKLLPIKEFFAARWQRIRADKSLTYLTAPDEYFNTICLQLATAMADVVPEWGRMQLLIPTIEQAQSDITYTFYDDPEVKPELMILNEDKTRFIEVQACLEAAEIDGIYKNTMMIDGQITLLTPREKSDVINFSKPAKKYAEAIAGLRSFASTDDKDNLNKSMGSHMQKLAERLQGGGAYHVPSELKASDHRKATHTNAGESANIGIVEFSYYVDHLPQQEKDKLFALRSHDIRENFGQIWQRLSTPNVVDLSDTRYCVELLSPQITRILRANPDVYNQGHLTLAEFENRLAEAKKEFIDSLNINVAKPALFPSDLVNKTKVFAAAIKEKETDFALVLLESGIIVDELYIVTVNNKQTYLLTLAVEKNEPKIVDALLTKPLSQDVLLHALASAITSNKTEMVIKLLSHVNNIDKTLGADFLSNAVKNDNLELVKMLLDRGILPHVYDSTRRYPIAWGYAGSLVRPNCMAILNMLMDHPTTTGNDLARGLSYAIEYGIKRDKVTENDLLNFIERHRLQLMSLNNINEIFLTIRLAEDNKLFLTSAQLLLLQSNSFYILIIYLI